jgi:FkbM family methyltransferase
LIVDTRRLFLKLLRTFEIGTVCDVGSLDGTDALRFRRALPSANVIALEPNPRNFVLMESDLRLRSRGIRVLPLAAGDRETDAQFFVVRAEYAAGRDLAFRGMSSLHRRADSSLLAEVVRVRTVRLDSLLTADGNAGARVALWIDTEGMAFETIAGASGVLGRTQMLHVEVETVPCIGADQRVFSDVERLLLDSGFTVLATDQPRTSMQLNALFVRADLLHANATEIRWHVADAALRRRVKRAVLPLLPRRVRRFLSRHANAVRT